MATTVPVTMDTLITIKISIQGSNRKFKIPMRDLGAGVLPGKVSELVTLAGLVRPRLGHGQLASHSDSSDHAKLTPPHSSSASSSTFLPIKTSSSSASPTALAPTSLSTPRILKYTRRFSALQRPS